jgi:hypothetical protein
VKESRLSRIITIIVFSSLVLSIIYITVRIIMVPGGKAAAGERPESEYILMLLQCTAGVLIMFLPGFISKKFSVTIPSTMYIIFVIFLFCAIYLGEVRAFFYQFKHWDVLLHAVSGGMLGALGFSFVSLLNDEERIPVYLSPLFVSLFAFCFAIMLGVLWELYEFAFDGLLGLNMQKYALEDGTLLVGRDALVNTMKDLISDAVGALVVSVIGYISLKHKKGWLDSLLIRKKKTRTEAQDSGEAIEAGADAADETAKAARSDRKSSGEAAYAGKDPQNGIGIGQ